MVRDPREANPGCVCDLSGVLSDLNPLQEIESGVSCGQLHRKLQWHIWKPLVSDGSVSVSLPLSLSILLKAWARYPRQDSIIVYFWEERIRTTIILRKSLPPGPGRVPSSPLMKIDLCSWVGRLHFIKDVQIHPSCSTEAARSLSKVLTLQITWKCRGLTIAKIHTVKAEWGKARSIRWHRFTYMPVECWKAPLMSLRPRTQDHQSLALCCSADLTQAKKYSNQQRLVNYTRL